MANNERGPRGPQTAGRRSANPFSSDSTRRSTRQSQPSSRGNRSQLQRWQPAIHVSSTCDTSPQTTHVQEAAIQGTSILSVYPDEVDFGIVARNETPTVAVVIQKKISNRDIKLVAARVKPLTQSRVMSFSVDRKDTFWIVDHEPNVVEASFKPPYEGRFQATLELIFADAINDDLFVLTRKLVAIVGSREDHKRIKAKGPHVKRKFTPLPQNIFIIRSTRPPVWTATLWKIKLPPFISPQNVIDVVFRPHATDNDGKRFLPSLSVQSYGKYFSVLIHIEAEHRKRELDMYAMSEVNLVADHPRYRLAVPGLEQRRPSIIVGDFVLVQQSHLPNGPWIESRVHKVERTEIFLRFPENFSVYKGTEINVRFQLNKLPFRRMLQAITTSFSPTRLLFPDAACTGTSRALTSASITPLNTDVPLNLEQLDIVAAITRQPPGSIPFVVFGPPGTGKTITILEAMNQLLDRDPNCRILACTPSNAAADLIAEKMTFLGIEGLFRLNSLSRSFNDLSPILRPFSLINSNFVFAMPPIEVLQTYRVIVSTCVSGGVPSGLGIARGHFSHIFIDEAGQATEPEAMIPIKTMADEKTNVILAGDNKQMGPNVRSKIAANLGLQHSYLHRLMSREVYSLNDWRGITIVKLVKNFRSHEAILKIPNTLFYNGELRACADRKVTHSLVESDVLVKKGFPIVFHGVVGEDEQEESSPSYFNIDEASLVKEYCEKLLIKKKRSSTRNAVIPQEDVGIITPYSAQRWKIVELIRDHRRLSEEKIKIGSVEEFQGRERRVIILSTVRSKTENLQTDVRTALGFVSDATRFNVAITRAKAMLIVIGNPHILGLDPHWRIFLNYVYESGGWRGEMMSWDPAEHEERGVFGSLEEEEMQRLRSVVIPIPAAEDDILV